MFPDAPKLGVSPWYVVVLVVLAGLLLAQIIRSISMVWSHARTQDQFRNDLVELAKTGVDVLMLMVLSDIAWAALVGGYCFVVDHRVGAGSIMGWCIGALAALFGILHGKHRKQSLDATQH